MENFSFHDEWRKSPLSIVLSDYTFLRFFPAAVSLYIAQQRHSCYYLHIIKSMKDIINAVDFTYTLGNLARNTEQTDCIEYCFARSNILSTHVSSWMRVFCLKRIQYLLLLKKGSIILSIFCIGTERKQKKLYSFSIWWLFDLWLCSCSFSIIIDIFCSVLSYTPCKNRYTTQLFWYSLSRFFSLSFLF